MASLPSAPTSLSLPTVPSASPLGLCRAAVPDEP
jgi:hypothetical protein